ncbi:alpha/beta hydrolase [Pseudoduganella lutea]|uniref:Alpha/beta hydrolase n=1 Tax=Pseudoduganella lutea TaxID=321985 RepID=A0A4P6L493_9BURK|nr:alpha/beta hydrolase [Pseudoduganella lutea]QBE66244.1 alpha/beta hydrolase [Pseudoduganella lutea]
MDVLTTALTAAIADGGTGAAYEMLKSRLMGKSPRVDEAVADLEQDPGSLSRQFAVSDALAAAGLAGDRYLRAAARNLVEEVDRRRALRAMPGPADAANHAVLQVFFATDRQVTGDRHPARQFGAGRGELSYGSCEVSVPRGGQEDGPALPTLLRLQARADPDGHAMLLRSDVVPRDQYFPMLADSIGKAAGSALLFVPGYRTSFEDAARRTAQIAHGLRFAGVPMFYSWPSQGRLSGYMVDETNVGWSEPRLAAFLIEFIEQAAPTEVLLLAHGMGARALAGATIAALAARPDLAPRLRHIILAAPDIDAGAFQRDIAPALVAAGTVVTLYAASGDEALRAAHQTRDVPRAGDSGAVLLPVAGVQTIDASAADTSFTGAPQTAPGHSILADIRQLIAGQPAAGRSGLQAVESPIGHHWSINP